MHELEQYFKKSLELHLYKDSDKLSPVEYIIFI